VTQSVFSGRYRRLRELLIEARKKAGLTQVELAQKLSRPQSFVSKYELGERRLDVVEFLEVAGALGTKPERVLKCLALRAGKGSAEE
jgi:transcriptional regulator with XRE-family HTH domain